MKTLILVAVLAAITIAGDYFLKLASLRPASLSSREFVVGTVLYAATGAGWVIAMKHMTLAAIGVTFSVLVILMLTGVGVFVFKESLSGREMVGLSLAVVSLGLMSRFS